MKNNTTKTAAIVAIYCTFMFGFSGCSARWDVAKVRDQAEAAQKTLLDQIPEDERLNYLQSERDEYDYQQGKLDACNQLLQKYD